MMKILILKIYKLYKQKRLFEILKFFIHIYTISLIPRFGKRIIKINIPNRINCVKKIKDEELLFRIFNSYKLMKKDQKKTDILYYPSENWEYKINSDYKDLLEANNNDNFIMFANFILNFGISEKWLGIDNYYFSKKN